MTSKISPKTQEIEKKNHQELISAFAENNMNLNLCKHYLSKLIQSHLTCVELKRDIKEFLKSISNEK